MSFTLKYEGEEINTLLDKAGTALQEHQDISHLATKKEVEGVAESIPTKVSQLYNDTGYLSEHQDISHLATREELSDGLNEKQGIIEDLEAIRENAAKGATALQSIPSEYITEEELEGKGYITEHQSIEHLATKKELEGKQNKIDDLDGIREGASRGATALQSVPEEYVTEEELDGKGFITEHQSLEHLATKAELEGKVDKVVGKQLSTEDFTTLLKEKLDSLKNYDDTALVSRIGAIQETIDTLLGEDASSAIESFNEIIAFLEGIEDSENLDSIIASIEQQIAEVAKAMPTKVSELENDEGYLTEHQDLSHLATKGELESGLSSKQNTISDLDDIRSGAAKGATALQSYTEQYRGTVTGVKINGTTKNPSNGVVDLGTVITEHQDISGKADIDDIPTKVSQLTNDSKYQTEANVFGTVLFNVESTAANYGAVTLSDSTANYEFIDIYAATNDKHVFFSRVYQPNGKKIILAAGFMGNTSLFFKSKVYDCNGNKLTTASGTNGVLFSGEWGSEKNTLARGENTVGIWRVVGFKR